MNAEILKLENQLCFPLYAAAKAMVKKYTPFLESIKLTYTQYITMMVMWEQKTISVKDLGKHLYLDSGTLTPLLKRLEGKKLISRTRGINGDERLVYVSVTPKGAALKTKALRVPQEMGKCLSLDPQEAHALYTLLYKLLGRLEGPEDQGGQQE
ncbi:MAG: MarR family transcriptional regulator [Treponema sp.]|jgi:DNA-binding MarR family transcriptional regulator|nr:MarR family transcriptional regulator [Treponema sp.]